MSTTESGPIPVREGDLIAGKYRIEKEIGAGGMGVIVAARHEQLEQRVAIKFVRSETLGNEEGIQRFLREARAAVRLRSEHAARVLDVGTLDSGVPFMVMEFLEGADLARVLHDRGPLPVEVAATWIAQACEALAEAHAAGIVHRDLKPQNLFLARSVGGTDHVKVLDFGVSKSVEPLVQGPGALTRTSALLGSPLYMAPEQMRSSRDVDARADVWALGVVLFELLTRRWPFEAETLPALCLKVVGDPPLPLAELRPDVPEELVAIVETCLAKDPLQRFANAAELSSALEPFLPPGARILVERARLAMKNAPGVAPSYTLDAPSPAALRASSRALPPRRTTPTPSAWGSSRAESTKRTRMAMLLVATLVFAVAAVGGVGLALHDHAGSAPEEAKAVAASPVAAAQPSPAASEGKVPVVALAPPPAEVVPVAVPSAVAAAVAPASATPIATAPSASEAGAVATGTPRVPAAPPPVKPVAFGAAAAGVVAPTASAKSGQDDDIPSLR